MVTKREGTIDYKSDCHNDIVLKLDKLSLIKMFSSYFGREGIYSAFHFICDKEEKDYTLKENEIIYSYFISPNARYPLYKDKKLNELRSEFINDKKIINATNIINSFDVQKTFEFPIIKGEGVYKSTKGFIDLIVHIKPLSVGFFSCYPSYPKEFVIEIKKEKDFKDFGSILRQIKEYRSYYHSAGVNKWNTDLFNNDIRKYQSYFEKEINSYFVVLSDKIPEEVKPIFTNEGIITISLNDFIKEGGE